LSEPSPTRRDALVAALAASAALSHPACAQTGDHTVSDPSLEQHRHDWDWLVGDWRVRHHRLKDRLAGSTEWQAFDGACAMIPTLNGFGNMDDNWLDLPAGAYRAMGIRAFNPETRLWSIWWFDQRSQNIDPPVRGGFRDGVGEFVGDDTFRGQPIKVRFRWTEITATSARWEQAFSPDDGATWEVNWWMAFTRA
jgi:hypothetical protein